MEVIFKKTKTFLRAFVVVVWPHPSKREREGPGAGHSELW